MKKCNECIKEGARKRQTVYRTKYRSKINTRRRKNWPEYYDEHREELKSRSMSNYRKDPKKAAEKNRERTLRVFFNLTPEEYTLIREYQRTHEPFNLLLGKNEKIKDAVEHRHKDGLVRGVMANLLNRYYGAIENLYRENTSAVLRALATFHDSPPATEVLGARYGLIGKAQYKKKMIYGSPDGPIKASKKARS